MPFYPVIERLDRTDDPLAQIGEAVLDAPRRILETLYEPIPLQSPQDLGEYLSGDAADEVSEFVVAWLAPIGPDGPTGIPRGRRRARLVTDAPARVRRNGTYAMDVNGIVVSG